MDPIEKNEESGKVEKQHVAIMKKLVTLVGNDSSKLKLPKRVPKGSIESLVAELFKEEHEAIHKLAKEQLRETLKKYAEMENHFKQQEQQLAKLKDEKKKEFNKAAQDLLNKFESTDGKIAEYAKGIKQATEDASDESEAEVKE